MKGEFFKNATQNFNHGNFECKYPVAMDGIQDLLFKKLFFFTINIIGKSSPIVTA